MDSRRRRLCGCLELRYRVKGGLAAVQIVTAVLVFDVNYLQVQVLECLISESVDSKLQRMLIII